MRTFALPKIEVIWNTPTRGLLQNFCHLMWVRGKFQTLPRRVRRPVCVKKQASDRPRECKHPPQIKLRWFENTLLGDVLRIFRHLMWLKGRGDFICYLEGPVFLLACAKSRQQAEKPHICKHFPIHRKFEVTWKPLEGFHQLSRL